MGVKVGALPVLRTTRYPVALPEAVNRAFDALLLTLPAATVPATAMAASSATHTGAAQLLGGRLLGGETSSWSEHADPTNLMQRVLTRAAAVAERLWSGSPSHLDVARQRLAAVRCRLVQRGLHAEPVMPDHC